MTTLREGIASSEEMKASTMAWRAASVVSADEPKVWVHFDRIFRQGALRRQWRATACHRREGARLARCRAGKQAASPSFPSARLGNWLCRCRPDW